jgi:hypothetical protein
MMVEWKRTEIKHEVDIVKNKQRYNLREIDKNKLQLKAAGRDT